MTTATHSPRTPEPTSTTDAAASTAGATGSTEASPHFRRLLGQRRLFGQLAECQRSHHGENTNTAMLDDVVDLLTHELDLRFPQQWRALEPELLVAELHLQHDPTDGAVAGCGLCHAATMAHDAERRRTRRVRPRPPVAGRQRTHRAAAAPTAARGQEAA